MHRCSFYTPANNREQPEQNLPTYLLFIDYEKAYDSSSQDIIWSTLKNYNAPAQFMETIKSIYKNTKNCMIYGW
jgi:hypothetical protein